MSANGVNFATTVFFLFGDRNFSRVTAATNTSSKKCLRT